MGRGCWWLSRLWGGGAGGSVGCIGGGAGGSVGCGEGVLVAQ